MRRGLYVSLILFFAFGGVAGSDGTVSTELVEAALARAGAHATELRRALQAVSDEQRGGLRFLIANMPQRDLQELSADFLLKNVRFAYRAWHEALWHERVPEAMFLNNVLPYASVTERRDDWREDFYTRFRPLVAKAQSPSEAAVILNREVFPLVKVHFSRARPKTDQSPYETIDAGIASCTGLSVVLVDACRAVGVPARLAGTPLWTDRSGNHSWVEIWDGTWHYTGAAEPTGDRLDRAWFTDRATTARADQRLHAIYAVSFARTAQTFPLVWDRQADYVYAVNVTSRYAGKPDGRATSAAATGALSSGFDVEASLHAVAQLTKYLASERPKRPVFATQGFAGVALTRADAARAEQLLWQDHVEWIKESRAVEMKERQLTIGKLKMPFFYTVSGKKPDNGRSLYISLHGGGGAPKQVNDSQWENQKRLYRVPEGVYLAPRAPTNTWNLWHQAHIDGLFDRLIEDLILFEDVDPNRVYLLGFSAGGDGVYQLAPRMADRFAAAAMMSGHPNEASPLGLRNLPFTIQAGGKDAAYNRNKVARSWGRQLDELQQADPGGYVHWTRIYENKGHWLDREDAAALPWMAKHTRNPLPERIVWCQDDVTHRRFYWLAVEPEDARKGVVVRARVEGQRIDVETDGIKQVILRANDRMLDLDREVAVTSHGRELYRGRFLRTIGTLAKTMAERGDPASVFSSEGVVTLPEQE